MEEIYQRRVRLYLSDEDAKESAVDVNDRQMRFGITLADRGKEQSREV